MYKWEYVKGPRAPEGRPHDRQDRRPAAADRQLLQRGLDRRRSGRLDPLRLGLRRRDAHSVDPNPTPHVHGPRPLHRRPDGHRLVRQDRLGQSTMITAGNTTPTVVVNTPVAGGTFAFGDDIPFTVTVTDPEDGAINCSEVQVTFVLGHDTHGHAEAGTTGCSGVLHTDAGDVSHGGNVFGVISATYTDHGVGHDNVQTLSTTSRTRSARSTRRSSSWSTSPARTRPRTRRRPTAGRRAPPRQPRRGRLDPAQRPVQPAEHQRDVTFRVADAATRPHRGLTARGDRGPSGHAHRADRADVQPGLDGRHGHLDEPDVPDLAVGHA